MIGQPRNYSDMLKRIFWGSLIVGLASTTLLSFQSPDVEAFVNLSAEEWNLGPFKLPILFVLVPAGVAIVARVITLHDFISHVFTIRKRFDVAHILVPLATEVGIKVNDCFRKTLKDNRDELMGTTFYEYVPDADSAKINPQLVVSALDRWGWFWCCVEPIPILILASIVAWYLVEVSAVIPYLIASILFALSAVAIWPSCVRAARIQIKAIASDQDRRQKIRGIFDALQDQGKIDPLGERGKANLDGESMVSESDQRASD